jgi:hypothetical protein
MFGEYDILTNRQLVGLFQEVVEQAQQYYDAKGVTSDQDQMRVRIVRDEILRRMKHE